MEGGTPRALDSVSVPVMSCTNRERGNVSRHAKTTTSLPFPWHREQKPSSGNRSSPFEVPLDSLLQRIKCPTGEIARDHFVVANQNEILEDQRLIS